MNACSATAAATATAVPAALRVSSTMVESSPASDDGLAHRLVDAAAHMVEAIWPLSAPAVHRRCTLPLRAYIEKTVSLSSTSYHTLHLALYYLLLLRPVLPPCDFTMEQPSDGLPARALQCGRRMFLAALMVASKFVLDRNYSARVWSRWTKLAANEITANERAFLVSVDYRLHLSDALYARWQHVVRLQARKAPTSLGTAPAIASWRRLLSRMSPDLVVSAPLCSSLLLVAAAAEVAQAADAAAEASAEAAAKAPAHAPADAPALKALPILEPKLTLEPKALPACPELPHVDSMSRNGLEMYHFPTPPLSVVSPPSVASASSVASAPVAATPSGSVGSPESLVTDRSLSSRTSSVSSATSWASRKQRLAKQASFHCAHSFQAALQSSPEEVDDHDSDIFPLDQPTAPTPQSMHHDDTFKAPRPQPVGRACLSTLSSPNTLARSLPTVGRAAAKRSRSPPPLLRSLQDDVRQLLQADLSKLRHTNLVRRAASASASASAPASSEAPLPLERSGPVGLQPPCGAEAAARLPVPRALGKKRSCCTVSD